MKHRIAQLSLLLVVVIGCAAWLIQVTTSAETSKDKAVSKEFVSCLSAICIDKSPGQQCLELNSNITHVYVTEDANVIGAQRIVIETTDKRCGTSIFK